MNEKEEKNTYIDITKPFEILDEVKTAAESIQAQLQQDTEHLETIGSFIWKEVYYSFLPDITKSLVSRACALAGMSTAEVKTKSDFESLADAITEYNQKIEGTQIDQVTKFLIPITNSIGAGGHPGTDLLFVVSGDKYEIPTDAVDKTRIVKAPPIYDVEGKTIQFPKEDTPQPMLCFYGDSEIADKIKNRALWKTMSEFKIKKAERLVREIGEIRRKLTSSLGSLTPFKYTSGLTIEFAPFSDTTDTAE